MFSIRIPAAALLFATFAITACDDDDDDPITPTATTFNVTLTSAAERPAPCGAAGVGATGSGTVTINAAETSITTNITFSGLSSTPPTMAHIHTGGATVAGDIILTFTDLTSPITQTFTAADYPTTPPVGAPATFAAFVDAMKAGTNSYVNIHTTACGAGEIRGNLTPP